MNVGTAMGIAKVIVLSANQYINFDEFEKGAVAKYVKSHDDKHRSQTRAMSIASANTRNPVSYYQQQNPANLQQTRDLTQSIEADMLRAVLKDNWTDNARYHESYNFKEDCVNANDFNLICPIPNLFAAYTLRNGNRTACTRMVVTMGKQFKQPCIHTHFPITDQSFNQTYSRPLPA